jgi:hypothetical protein
VTVSPLLPAGDGEVLTYAAERGITEVLHFTTNKGLTGILATGAVKSRRRLDSDKHIEHIYTPNCENRLKDREWTDYVNLSISRVNGQMLGVSENWHRQDDVWWLVLAFGPEILADPGVFFTTTNNTYTNCVVRGQGVQGLSALFAESVEWGWYGSRKRRYSGIPDSWPTDPQAEVLYPGEISLRQLTSIYVRRVHELDDVRGLLGAFPSAPSVPVLHKPEVFQ